jgi:hypothetical protein
MLASTTTRTLLSAAILLVVSPGCGAAAPALEVPPASAQTFADAIGIICDVDRLAGLSVDEDVLAIGQKRSEWLADRIENPDGIELRTRLSVKSPEEQAVTIRAKAREVGLASCTLADSIEQLSAGGLSP